MFSFSTTAYLTHVTPLPPGTTFEAAVEKIHNHDLLIRLDPELAHYEELPADASTPPNAKRYHVTDHMHTLPKGLWDTTVSFEATIIDTEDGIKWIIKAPLGLVQTSTWKVVRSCEIGKGKEKATESEEGEDGKLEKSEWSLVEDVEIKASRLLVGTVKSKCEDNWRGVHGRFVGHLKQIEAKA